MKNNYKYQVSKNNFMCPHDVFEEKKFKKMKLSSKILYVILCKLANRFSDKDGWFWRSVPQLIEDTNFNKKTITKAKKELFQNQYIDVKRTYFQHSNLRSSDSFRLNGFRFRAR